MKALYEADIPVRVMPTEAYFELVRQMLSAQGRACVRVTGTSMMPLLRHLRDRVILAPPRGILVGDIVLFDRRNGRYALHRVVRKHGNTFDMAGDNQWHLEEGLPCDQIVAMAVAIERNGRRISRRSPLLRAYSRAMAWAAFPRIRARRALGRLLTPFRRPAADNEKGTTQ